VELTLKAAHGPVVTKVPTVGQFLHRWLEETVAPNLAPLTYATYESHVKNYIEPGIGALRLDRLRVPDVQAWLNRLAVQCQCCAQGKDARRALGGTARCCAIGECCHQVVSPRTIKDVRTVLRSALHSAVRQELIDRNVAQLVQIPKQRKRKLVPWTSEEARRFLESARSDSDPLYAAYVLVLILGLRRARFSASLGRPSISSTAHLCQTISCSESVDPCSTGKRRLRHPMLGCLCPRSSLRH
jgi:integrase